jgi:hypothetical protein
MFKRISILIIILSTIAMARQDLSAQSGKEAELNILHTDDFEITGEGTSDPWEKTEWVEIPPLKQNDRGENPPTRAKLLYSDTGLYVLFDCEDAIVSASMTSDFMELWREDVVEIFLWPDESEPVYFEYELSPLNYELPILVSNNDGKQSHWIPFDYSYKDDRKTRHKTSVEGGRKESGASITKWRAEFFIPFELMRPLKNIFPESGTRWRANMYRMDYDDGHASWAWQPVTENFHQYDKFGTFIFE